MNSIKIKKPGAELRTQSYKLLNDTAEKNLEKMVANISAAIEALTTMEDKDKPFVPRSYKAFQRNTFFTLLSISLLAECLYFIFQEETSEAGLRPYFPSSMMWLSTTIAYVAATGDWDANLWTVSPRDDSDEYILTSTTQSYTPITLALIRLYYLSGAISFPIGAAGGWLGLNKYSSAINDDITFLTTNIFFFALLVAVGTIYYVAWCKPLADKTFAGIDEYQKAKRHDYSLSRYSEVAMEGTSVTVYRSLGFGAIAGYIPEGFGYTLNKPEQKALFSVGLVSTFIVTLLTRPVKITNAWLSGLYAEVTESEYAEAARSKDLVRYEHIFNSKNLMSMIVAAGLAGLLLSFSTIPFSIRMMTASIAALLPIAITINALRDLAILKIAVKNVGEDELRNRRNIHRPVQALTGYEARYNIACDGFNALAATYEENKNITRRAQGSSFLGRVARGTSFLGFTEDLNLIGIVLNKTQQLFVALIFGPHNLLNEFVAFSGGMIYYLTQKYAQAYVYSQLDKDPNLFQKISGFRCFYYGKADFTPNELIHALELKRNELLEQLDQDPEAISEIQLRGDDQPRLSTFTECVRNTPKYIQSFFSNCVQNSDDEAAKPLLAREEEDTNLRFSV